MQWYMSYVQVILNSPIFHLGFNFNTVYGLEKGVHGLTSLTTIAADVTTRPRK